MIDWYLVFTSSLWILGLSIILAALGYHQWEAGEHGRRLRGQSGAPSWRACSTGGMFLVTLGFGLSEGLPWWQRAAWLVLTVLFARDACAACVRLRHRGPRETDFDPGDRR